MSTHQQSNPWRAKKSIADESGRPGTCKSNVGCEAIEEPCTNKMVPMLFDGSPAHFSHMNSVTPPSLVVQCSVPVIGWVISFIAYRYDFHVACLEIGLVSCRRPKLIWKRPVLDQL